METQQNAFAYLALDVDGTLINNAKVISPFTRQEVCRVVEEEQLGLVLASSRMPRSLRNVMRELGVIGHIVAYNGALAQCWKDGRYETMLDISLPRGMVQALLQQPLPETMHVGLFFGDQWVVSDMDYWALREARTSQTWPDVIGLPDDVAARSDNPHKLMMRGDAKTIDTVLARVMVFHEHIEVYRPKGNLVEITSNTVSKAGAIKQVVGRTGHRMENLLAFGDNLNDTDMLAAAGWGIAMSNAPDSVKQLADEVTLSNDEDGVGYMIRKHFPYPTENFRPWPVSLH